MAGTSLEEELKAEGECLTQTKGISMRPLLTENLSTVWLVRPDRPVKPMDVVLYRSSSGELILHRVWKIRGSALVLRTDNSMKAEKIRKSQVIGIAKGYYRDATGDFWPAAGVRDRIYRGYLKVRLVWKIIKNGLKRKKET